MTVVYLDQCHQCERPIAAGIFCQLCLAASDVAVPTSDLHHDRAPGDARSPRIPAEVGTTAAGLVEFRRRRVGAPRTQARPQPRTNKNGPALSVVRAGGGTAPTTPAA